MTLMIGIQLAMTCILFVIGILMTASGFSIIVSREYHETLRQLPALPLPNGLPMRAPASSAPQQPAAPGAAASTTAAPSKELVAKGIVQDVSAATIDSFAQLFDAIRGLIQTAVGIGVLLCIMGIGVCGMSFWMALQIAHI
ncbi:MAG: hypothetical protein NVS4B8_22210 [Herpetosiphon sp.]